ncbi:MAG TPA: class I SAM-dependent methyltransferase [Puia sp.]|nr:class I SAM-dependent methyltransferase [Puia sp.]
MHIKDQTGLATLNIISKADKLNRWMYETISPHFSGKIIELGSGIGNISRYVIANHSDVTLSDFDEYYFSILQKTYGEHPNVNAILKIDLQHPDFSRHYLYLKENFDTVICLNVIEHLADDNAAIQNCRYLLKPGGIFIGLVPAYQFLFCHLDRELGHFRRYTASSFKERINMENMKVIKVKYFNALGIAGWFFKGVILRSKNLTETPMSIFNTFVPVARIFDKLLLNSTGLSVIAIAQK